MQTMNEIVSLCLNFESVYQDWPFHTQTYSVIRHNDNKKVFVLIFEKDNNIWVNLKVKPDMDYFLKQVYEAVVPAYHMNKEHWISVILDGSISSKEIKNFVTTSYNLTKSK